MCMHFRLKIKLFLMIKLGNTTRYVRQVCRCLELWHAQQMILRSHLFLWVCALLISSSVDLLKEQPDRRSHHFINMRVYCQYLNIINCWTPTHKKIIHCYPWYPPSQWLSHLVRTKLTPPAWMVKYWVPYQDSSSGWSTEFASVMGNSKSRPLFCYLFYSFRLQ